MVLSFQVWMMRTRAMKNPAGEGGAGDDDGGGALGDLAGEGAGQLDVADEEQAGDQHDGEGQPDRAVGDENVQPPHVYRSQIVRTRLSATAV